MANELVNCLFAGLVEYDLETNIIPHVARSWEVLDGGLRYIFHLRDDVLWTDGTQVTAVDFEWAWKRNLAPGEQDFPAKMLDDVIGARAYRLGANPDAASVGVHALGPLTLEVQLESPATYFIYLTAHPVTYPLPIHIVKNYGQEWWKPPHSVSNGPFQLVEYSTTGLKLQRNPSYFGDFPGNLDGIEMHFIEVDDKEMQIRFLDQQFDLCPYFYLEGANITIPNQLLHYRLALDTSAIVLNPVLPPLNDSRVRQAIAQGLDFKRIMESYKFIGGARRNGGLLPPGMMGHSPELGLPYNLSLARQLLSEAGFPDGKGFPVLNFCSLAKEAGMDEIIRQLTQDLGIQCDLQIWPFLSNPRLRTVNLIAQAWVADYPDPDNFLRASFFLTFLKETGWRHARYDALIAEATQSRNQLHRMKLYREADRILVNDEMVIIPFMHSISGQYLIHPWVSGCDINALDLINYKCIRLQEKDEPNPRENRKP
jgi:oligopeptide transport system substrate-binding protein